MGFIRDRIAARHHQPSCQPCDSQPHFVQSPCAPQPLVYNTPYAAMSGGCQPSQFQPVQFQPTADRSTMPAMPSVTIVDAAPKSDQKAEKQGAQGAGADGSYGKKRGEKSLPDIELRRPSATRDQTQLPRLSVEDHYQFDGGKPAKRSESRSDAQSDRTRQLEKELRITRDEIDNLKKQIEQLRADQKALLTQLQQPGGRAVVQPPVAGAPYIPHPGQQGPFTPPPVVQPGQLGPLTPPPVAQPGQHAPYAPPPVAQPGQHAPYAPPPVAQPGQPSPLAPKQTATPPADVKPWEAPAQPPVVLAKPWEAPAPQPKEVKPPTGVVPPVAVPGQPGSGEAPKIVPQQPPPLAPVQPPAKAEVQRQTPPVLQPGQPPQPGQPAQPGKAPEKPKDEDDPVKRALAESKRLVAAQKDRKIEEVKAPFERFMQGERQRLTRAMDNSAQDHPEMTSANTSWLLSQDNERLIRDSGYKKKLDDVGWCWTNAGVIEEENKVKDERAGQWEQVRNNASNKNDPYYERKQGILNEIMNGWHLMEGRKFGRKNDDRGDNPLCNNKLQWQIDAAEALVRVNNTAGISHDYSTRAIIRGLVGDVRANTVVLPVPEAARIKLLEAITPMSKESGNAFLGANSKDTAVATVVTALERSHDSRKPEADFQIAAINKLSDLDDIRGMAVLQKLAAESASTKVRELAAKKVEALREKVMP
ncbi:MAG TPA: hypothetical protein V6C89_00475 [Drouetiella sp.]